MTQDMRRYTININDKAKVKLLEIECDFTDDYLIGHAKRVGLASDRTPKETIDRLMPTIRYDVSFESDRIRDAGFANFLVYLQAKLLKFVRNKCGSSGLFETQLRVRVNISAPTCEFFLHGDNFINEWH